MSILFRIRIIAGLFILILGSIDSHASEFYQKQTGTATLTGLNVTAAITSVDMTRSFLVFSATVSDTDPGDFQVGGEITNATTLTFYKNDLATSTITIKWQVFEFTSGVSVQHGSTAAVTSPTNVAITSVDLTKSFVIATGRKDGTTLGNDDGFTAELTTATNLQLDVAGGTYTEVYWQVVEYEDAFVQVINSTSLTGTTATSTIPLDVCPNKSIVISYHTIGTNILAYDLPRTELTDGTTVTYTRVNSTGTLNFITYVVEFRDNTVVEHGSRNFTSGTTTSSAPAINSVTTANAGVFGGGQYGRQGSTSHSGDDNVGHAWFTYDLTGSTTLQIDRAVGTASTADIPYQVVEFFNPVIYYSLATGAWDDNNSWSLTSDGSSGAVAAGVWPRMKDNVVIRSGHTITVDDIADNKFCGKSPDNIGASNVGAFTSSDVDMFYHRGEIIVDAGGTYSATLRSMYEGFTYVNGTFTSTADVVNLGNLEVTSVATFNTDDDIVLSGNSFTVFDNTSTSDDDIYIDHTDALLCGNGTFNVGNGGGDPEIQYLNGATEAQICSSLTITCTTNCGAAPFGAPTSPGNFSLGWTGPGGVDATDGTTALALWLDANTISQGTGTNLSTWSDQSGYGNDATSSGIDRPIFNTGQVNGFPAIQFVNDANPDHMLVSHDASLDPATVSVFVFGNMESTSDNNFSYVSKLRVGADPPDGYGVLRRAGNQETRFLIDAIANQVFATTTYGAYEIMSGIYDDPGLEYWFDEASQGTDTYAGPLTSHTNDMYIGATVNAAGTTPVLFLDGDIAEVIVFGRDVNAAERIIINNYMAAKYNIGLANNDVYEQDDAGDYDYEVAGIGQASDGTFNKDAQGTGLVRVNLPSDLDNDEFLMWGHDNTNIDAVNTTDVDGTIIEARLERVWRVSENDNTGTAVDVGTVRLTFDVSNLPATIVGSDMRLLITRDDALFIDNDVTPQAGSYNIDNQLVTFSNVSLEDGDYFTLGTTDNTNSPLPIDLISFEAIPKGELVELEWITASELNNDYFTVERSKNAADWEIVTQVEGQGTTEKHNEYKTIDDRPYSEISFYRLKQTDYDGTYTYSKTVSVLLESDRNVILYPNPSKGTFIIKTEFELHDADIFIHDLNGRRIQSTITREQYSAEVQLNDSPAGIYILEINDGSRVYKQKVLIDY